MAAKTDFCENLVLQWLLAGGAAPTRPTTLHIALHTADPGEAGTNGEISGNGYARQPCSFTVAADVASLAVAISFGPNVSADWGDVTHWSIKTALTGGNTLYKAALNAVRNVRVNDSLQFPAGSLVVSEE